MKLRSGTTFEHVFAPRRKAGDNPSTAQQDLQSPPPVAEPGSKYPKKRTATEAEAEPPRKRTRTSESQYAKKETPDENEAGRHSAASVQAQEEPAVNVPSGEAEAQEEVHGTVADKDEHQPASTESRKRSAADDAEDEPAAKKSRRDEAPKPKFPWYKLPGEIKNKIYREMMPTTRFWRSMSRSNRLRREQGKSELSELDHPHKHPYASFNPEAKDFYRKTPSYRAVDRQLHEEIKSLHYRDKRWVIEPVKGRTLDKMPRSGSSQHDYFKFVRYLTIVTPKIYGGKEHQENMAKFDVDLDARFEKDVFKPHRSYDGQTAAEGEIEFTARVEAELRRSVMIIWGARRENFVNSVDIEAMCWAFKRWMFLQIVINTGPPGQGLITGHQWLQDNA